ncbi:hypothetical protein [Xenorhabdus innexi]|uniref:Uncharacterized protein n=1 Tax=Xenorhabdus innexi TaxID=290109 RepID=A0A1N6MWH9_9GAMM|nr:hypothetical protein [Xenorhabdus innexi]PHM35929.1 hypothetical protein Xinn_01999 [Xenorhabdus innexi]SIP73228.1 hypothetical protein XIS1_1790034 [Xenorhabdus innexi]
MSAKRFGLFDGGNVLRRIDDTLFSAFNDVLPVQPAGHQKKRNHQLENHIDTQDFAYTGAYEVPGLSEKTDFKMPDGAEIATHLLGTGWLINAIVYHVKRVGAGTLTPFVELSVYDAKTGKVTGADKLPVVDGGGKQLVVDLGKPGFYLGYVPTTSTLPEPRTKLPNEKLEKQDTGNTTPVDVVIPAQTITVSDFKTTDGTGVTGTVTVPSQTVTIQIPRGASADGTGSGLPVPVLTTTNGYLVNTFTAGKDKTTKEALPFDACVGIYADITEFFDEHPCNCAPAPCETVFPDPECQPLN